MNKHYPEFTIVKQDILKDADPFPISGTLSDGVIKPGFQGENTRKTLSVGVIGSESSKVLRKTMICGDNNKVYINMEDDATLLGTLTKNMPVSNPVFVEYTNAAYEGRDEFCVMTDEKYLVIVDEGNFTKSIIRPVTCCAVKFGRLFGACATNPMKLYWSDMESPITFESGPSEGGEVTLEHRGGGIVGVFDFEEKIVLLREQCISFMTVGGDPEAFKLTKDIIALPQVKPFTGRVVGNRLLFLTEDGFMQYKNGKAERLGGLTDSDLAEVKKVTSYSERYYIVAGTSKSLDRDVMYVYDALENSWQIVDVPAVSFAFDSQSLVAYTDGYIYRIQPAAQYKIKLGKFNFGSFKRKLLTELDIVCDGEVTVEIDNGTYTHKFRTAGGRQRINMRGEEFEVTLSGGGKIYSCELFAEVRK